MATITHDSEAKAALARLLENYSAELTTRDHKSLDAAKDILRPQTRVFVAAMPRDTADDMIAAAIRLHKAGMEMDKMKKADMMKACDMMK